MIRKAFGEIKLKRLKPTTNFIEKERPEKLSKYSICVNQLLVQNNAKFKAANRNTKVNCYRKTGTLSGMTGF